MVSDFYVIGITEIRMDGCQMNDKTWGKPQFNSYIHIKYNAYSIQLLQLLKVINTVIYYYV